MLVMPLFFYPTTLTWIDDDGFFIKIVSDTFKEQGYRCKIYLSAASFLKFWEEYQATTDKISFFATPDDNDYEVNHELPVHVNFKSIIDLYYNKDRIKDMSAIIVDFKMPGVTGIELMQKLSEATIKRILLTGEPDDQLAIDAFNEGIIERFVRKRDCNFISDLNFYINRLTTQYFCDITKPLLSHLEADYFLPQSDPIFIDFFVQWAQINNIVEYFLFDKNGSMLAINKQGEAFYFVIHTERSLEAFIELHEEEKDAQFLISTIVKRHKIPFFGLFKESWEFEPAQWGHYFYAPEVLVGRETYYWKAIPSSDFT